MNSDVELEWIKFSKWKNVIDSDDYGYPCIYIVCDADRTPLYIWATTQKIRKVRGTLFAGGLRARYFHDWTSFRCMHGGYQQVCLHSQSAKG